MKKSLFTGLLLGGLLLPITVQAAEQCTVIVASTQTASQSNVLADGIVVNKGTTSFTLSYADYRNNIEWIDTNQYRIQMFSISDTGVVTSLQSVNNTNHVVRGDIRSNVTGDVDYYLESYSSLDLECPITCLEGEIWNETTEQCEPDGTCPEGEIWNETTEQCEPEPGPCEERLGPYYSQTWGDISHLDNKTVCWPGLEPQCYVSIEVEWVSDWRINPAGYDFEEEMPMTKFKYHVEPMSCEESTEDGVDLVHAPGTEEDPIPGVDPGLSPYPDPVDDPGQEPVADDPDPLDPTLPPEEMLGGYLRAIKADTGSLIRNMNKGNELLTEQLKQQSRDYRIQESQLGELQQIERGLDDVEGAIEDGVDDIEASIDGMAGRLEGAIDGLGSSLGSDITGMGQGIEDAIGDMSTDEVMPTVPEFDTSIPGDNDYTEFDDPSALATSKAAEDIAWYGVLMEESEPDTILGTLAAINPTSCLSGSILSKNVEICFDRPWMLTGYAMMKVIFIGIAYVQSMMLLMRAFQT